MFGHLVYFVFCYLCVKPNLPYILARPLGNTGSAGVALRLGGCLKLPWHMMLPSSLAGDLAAASAAIGVCCSIGASML